MCYIYDEEIRAADRRERERPGGGGGTREKEENEGVATPQQWQAGTLTRFPTMAEHGALSNWCQLSTGRSAGRQTEGISERRTGGTRFRRRETRDRKRSVSQRSLDHYERRVFQKRVVMISRRKVFRASALISLP